MKPFLLLLPLLIVPLKADAQSALLGPSDTRVTGTVEDETGRPLAGYPVIIAVPDGGENIVVFTDEDGTYSVEGLTAGDYEALPGTATANATSFTVTAPERRWFTRKPIRTDANTVTLPDMAVPLGPVKK